MDKTMIIGIDCATVETKVGLSLGIAQSNGCFLTCAAASSRGLKVSEKVVQWVNESDRTLIALDAPLGWPRPLGGALAPHRAGDSLPGSANSLFRRETDRHVKKQFGKQPLDVGADRIARTAVSALTLLGDIRRLTGLRIPLAWEPHYEERVAVIEVYPAATLIACGLRATNYKKRRHVAERATIVAGLEEMVHLQAERNDMGSNADVLDAAVCVLAGLDFLTGKATPPSDRDLAESEGWIWVRKHTTTRKR
jgi:predicted RNase H-like nuclease